QAEGRRQAATPEGDRHGGGPVSSRNMAANRESERAPVAKEGRAFSRQPWLPDEPAEVDTTGRAGDKTTAGCLATGSKRDPKVDCARGPACRRRRMQRPRPKQRS